LTSAKKETEEKFAKKESTFKTEKPSKTTKNRPATKEFKGFFVQIAQKK